MLDPRIIFEDAWMVVIDKPAGMVVNDAQTAKGETVQKWFSNRIRSGGNGEFYDKGGVVHRLDKDTSGVMVLAKTPEAYEKLKQQFLERKAVKKYVALVHGKLAEEEGIISAPIERNPKIKSKFTIGTDLSRTAITEWKVTRQWADFALLELAPHTGRTHQLRVHMQHLGHPIVADPIYGWKKTLGEDLKWCPRLFLHAKELEITHPGSGERVKFEALIPPELQRVLDLIH